MARARIAAARTRHGEVAVVETSGEEQIVLLDATDFRLLYALAACAAEVAELGGETASDARSEIAAMRKIRRESSSTE